jgi:hypothetical protein
MIRQPLTNNCKLSCGCYRVLTGTQRMGTRYYCSLHKKAVTILSTLAEYVADCLDCRYRRKWGQARLTALTKASAHSIRMHHRVDVYHGDTLVEEIGRSQQLHLPTINDPVLRKEGRV